MQLRINTLRPKENDRNSTVLNAFFIKILLKIAPDSRIDDKSVLVEPMAQSPMSTKPLPESILTKISDATRHQLATMSWWKVT